MVGTTVTLFIKFANTATDDPVRADGSIIYPLSPLGSQAGEGGQGDQPKQKKAKRVRLLLDARTELTNEELEVRRPTPSIWSLELRQTLASARELS